MSKQCVKNIQFISDYVFRIAQVELDNDTVTRESIKSYYGNQLNSIMDIN